MPTSASSFLQKQAAADALRKKHKSIPYQRLAAIQDELAKIDRDLASLRSKASAAVAPEDVAQNHLTMEDVVDPTVVQMLKIELAQCAAAGDVGGVRILLDGGADPNSRDYDDRTLLHIACMNGRLAVVNLILEYNVDALSRDCDGHTPLDLAEEGGYADIVQALLSYLECGAVVDSPRLMDSFPDGKALLAVSPHTPDFSSIPQPMVGSMIVIMVGLPGRGKTYIAQQICRYFQWSGLRSIILRHQVYKKNVEQSMSANSSGEAPLPTDVEFRVASQLAQDATAFVAQMGGVAVLDGTQSTPVRRHALLRAIKEARVINPSRIIFVEVISNNAEQIHQNILRARDSIPDAQPDFVEKYYAVIAQHEAVYKTLSAVDDRELSFIRIEDNADYALNRISGWMPSRLAYMMHNFSSTPVNLYLTRAGEYVDMVSGRIGGNSRLTERGMAYSRALFEFFQSEIPPTTPLTVLSSCAKRCTQTVSYFAEEVVRQQQNLSASQAMSAADAMKYRVVHLPTLDDVNHGDCEGQLLSDVRKTMPGTLKAMRADPYHTAWPNGESINQVFNARLEPHIHDIQASSCPVLVASHLHLLQGLYSYFVTREDNGVAPQDAYKIDIPFECVIKICMVGSERVAEVVELSDKVDQIIIDRNGQLDKHRTVDEDFNVFRRYGKAS